jgi:hypothetical protein
VQGGEGVTTVGKLRRRRKSLEVVLKAIKWKNWKKTRFEDFREALKTSEKL